MTNDKNIQQLVRLWSGLIPDKVCYLPGLGPVYSVDKPIDKVLTDILVNADEECFLNYDKNKRWYKKKQEKIVVSGIMLGDDWLCVPTLISQKSQLKIYVYSNKAIDEETRAILIGIYEKYKREEKSINCLVLSMVQPKIKAEIKQYNIYLKIISGADRLLIKPNEIFYYNELNSNAKSTFVLLGKEPEMDGFSFLANQMLSSEVKQSPIVCLVRGGEVIGAIGSLDVWADGWGEQWLLPPYFGVKEKFRGGDCGERLWKEAMNFAFIHGARYTLVQNSPDSLASRFYERQGLEKAGEVYVNKF